VHNQPLYCYLLASVSSSTHFSAKLVLGKFYKVDELVIFNFYQGIPRLVLTKPLGRKTLIWDIDSQCNTKNGGWRLQP